MDSPEIRELEKFANEFKVRRIKLGMHFLRVTGIQLGLQILTMLLFSLLYSARKCKILLIICAVDLSYSNYENPTRKPFISLLILDILNTQIFKLVIFFSTYLALKCWFYSLFYLNFSRWAIHMIQRHKGCKRNVSFMFLSCLSMLLVSLHPSRNIFCTYKQIHTFLHTDFLFNYFIELSLLNFTEIFFKWVYEIPFREYII